jgi:hypothetical protein
MNKDAIKVVKGNKKDAAEKTQAVANAPKVESDTQLTMVKAVKNWISERRENSRVEKVFSDDKILIWKIMP